MGTLILLGLVIPAIFFMFVYHKLWKPTPKTKKTFDIVTYSMVSILIITFIGFAVATIDYKVHAPRAFEQAHAGHRHQYFFDTRHTLTGEICTDSVITSNSPLIQ